MPDKVKALYNPLTGMIGCVILQAGVGGSSEVAASVFSTEDWEVAPAEGQAVMEATLEQWEFS